jgi:hypothetical protein
VKRRRGGDDREIEEKMGDELGKGTRDKTDCDMNPNTKCETDPRTYDI